MEKEITEWLARYDNTEEHDSYFNIEMKEDARLIFTRLLNR